KILNQLYKLTPLQMTFHYNMLALVDGIQPRVLGLQEILQEYIKHRQVVVRRRTEFELRKAKERAHILEGLKIALDHLDEVITTIRQSSSQEDARIALVEKFGMTEIQATAVLDLQLRRLAALERKKIEDELKSVLALIDELQGILDDPYKVLSIIKTELAETKEKYGDERRTQVIKGKVGEISEADLVADEEVLVTLTKSGYIKRLSPTTYRQQNRGGRGVAGMSLKEE